MIAFAYLRVSSKGQVGGDGFKRQAEAVEAFICGRGAAYALAFFDAGVTGTVADRSAIRELLSVAGEFRDSGHAVVVVVESADRLARDLLVSEVILQGFRDIGARVFTAGGVDLTDSADPTRNLVRQVLSAVAEYDKRALVAKLRSARERVKASRGRCEGVKPFGCLRHERKALDEILMLRSWGWTYERIAGHMNHMAGRDRDMLPRKGGRWYKGVVHAIVKASSERSSHAGHAGRVDSRGGFGRSEHRDGVHAV